MKVIFRLKESDLALEAANLDELAIQLLNYAYPEQDVNSLDSFDRLKLLAKFGVTNFRVDNSLTLFSGVDFPPYRASAPEHPKLMLNPASAAEDLKLAKTTFPGKPIGLVLPVDNVKLFFQVLGAVGILKREG